MADVGNTSSFMVRYPASHVSLEGKTFSRNIPTFHDLLTKPPLTKNPQSTRIRITSNIPLQKDPCNALLNLPYLKK